MYRTAVLKLVERPILLLGTQQQPGRQQPARHQAAEGEGSRVGSRSVLRAGDPAGETKLVPFVTVVL
jgi:hypothetical protein|eukprot:COSAG02_NODE_8562_length_2523_cov_1.619224_4_plen_67_part_00